MVESEFLLVAMHWTGRGALLSLPFVSSEMPVLVVAANLVKERRGTKAQTLRLIENTRPYNEAI